jgi:hypothetical protein
MVPVEFVKDDVRPGGSSKNKGIDRSLLQGPAMIGHTISNYALLDSIPYIGRRGHIFRPGRGRTLRFFVTMFRTDPRLARQCR